MIAAALFILACASTASTRIPVEIPASIVLMPVSINDGPPVTFILDTGASTTPVDKGYAAQRGIRGDGKVHAMGAGGSVEVSVAKDLRFTFGDITIKSPRTPLIPFDGIGLRAGRPFQGVLGAEAFRPYVVEIDYEKSVVTFHERSKFTPPAGATRLALEISSHESIPVVRGEVTLPDGRTLATRLFVDTGAGMGLVLTRAFADRQKIEFSGGIEMSAGLGVGGPTSQRVGRTARLSLGGLHIENPITALSRESRGALAAAHIDGLIGGEVLRRFTAFFDYGGKQLLLMPNRSFGEAHEYDMSGLMLTTQDATFRTIVVRDVLPDSPASEAGIRAGDELRAIDGAAVQPSQLAAIRAQLKTSDRRFVLTVVRDGAELTVPFVTRRLI
jgi:hypothetical protein